MGKATIISGSGDGQYSITLNLSRGRVTAELAQLAARISEIDIIIAGLSDGPEKDAAVLQKTALEKRVEYLNANVASDPVVTAWCCDLTKDLTGEVGTIEIPGERAGVDVLIQNGYQGNATYDSARDGQLQPVLGSTPAATVYNLAMHPGWQKWKPTFRLGEITEKNLNICSVAIDAANFSDRGSGLSSNINVNQDTEGGLVTLDNVPIEYMTCDGGAFSVGDRVIVSFTGQDWAVPKVIGFEDNPQPCAAGVMAIKIFGTYYTGALPFPGGTSDTILWLVWNTVTNAPLVVDKPGGGTWNYPLTDTEYHSGAYRANVQSMYGTFSYIGGVAPLVNSSGFVETDMTAGVPYYNGYEGIEIIDNQNNTIDWGNFDTQENIADYGDDYDATAAAVLATVTASGNTSQVRSIPEYNGSTLNLEGTQDTWTEAQDDADVETLDSVIWVDEEAGDEGWVQGGRSTPGQGIQTNIGSRSLSFVAPIAGVGDPLFFVGYATQSLSLLPPPVVTSTREMVLLNSSGGDNVIVGPSVSWSGTLSYSESTDLDYTVSPEDVTCTFANSQSGSGTLTFLDGQVIPISAAFSESGSVVSRDGEAFVWPVGYNPVATTSYAFSDNTYSSGYDTDDDVQLIIVLETAEKGDATNSLTPDPLTESVPVVTNQVVSYFLSNVKCDIVPDSETYNPWELAENTDLKTELYSMIDDFLAAEPVAAGDRWVLSTGVEILKF